MFILKCTYAKVFIVFFCKNNDLDSKAYSKNVE